MDTPLKNIKNIAYENYFYDLDHNDEKQFIENYFKNSEGRWNTAINSLIKKEDPNKLSKKQKYLIIEFIVSQLFRVKEERIRLEQLYNNELKKQNLNTDYIDDKLINNKIKFIHFTLINRIPIYVKFIEKMKMDIWINNTMYPYLTSDNPVIRFNRFLKDSGKGKGFKSPGFELYSST